MGLDLSDVSFGSDLPAVDLSSDSGFKSGDLSKKFSLLGGDPVGGLGLGSGLVSLDFGFSWSNSTTII